MALKCLWSKVSGPGVACLQSFWFLNICASSVPGIEHRGFIRDAYHIRRTTTSSQQGDWSAIIPWEQFPSLANRALLIKGPAQDLWHQSAEMYHQNDFCAKTKTVHSILEDKINNGERYWCYWLVVLPQMTRFENYILSDDAVHIKKESQDLYTEIKITDDVGNVEEIELFGQDVYWRIALQGGERISSPVAKKPAGERYKNRKKKAPTQQAPP